MRIRNLRTPEDFRAAEEFQRTVWKFPDREIIPLNELVVVQKHGGCVFGAFEGRRMTSFCFGMPAYDDGKTYHYSRMLGVLPGLRDRGLGMRMKLEQRKRVLDQGLDLIRWTVDPLQSRNASLNIAKLGCIVREYLVNIYPGSDSLFNRGMEADRFVPEWWIGSRHVREVLKGRRRVISEPAPAIEVFFNSDGWAEPGAVRNVREREVSVEIPSDLVALKKTSLPLARRWRRVTRRLFLNLFRRGYVVHDFRSDLVSGRRRSRYLLEKGFRIR